jgi:hypothetical protein
LRLAGGGVPFAAILAAIMFLLARLQIGAVPVLKESVKNHVYPSMTEPRAV